MTRYLGMNLRSLLVNPYLIFWSILFIEFWVFMWVYIFGSQIALTQEAVRTYAGLAYGNLLMLSLSGAAISIASSLLHSSKSVRYVTKFTKLSPSRLLFENLLSSLTVLLVISGIMFVSVLAAFYGKFGMIVIPLEAIGLFFSILLSTLFVYVLSLFLNLFIVSLKAARSASFISFVPMFLAFISYSALWIDFKEAVYISPFNCITSICYYYFSGKSPPTGNFFMPGEKALVDVGLAIVSLLIWLVLFIVLDMFLLRKMRGVGAEEIRIA